MPLRKKHVTKTSMFLSEWKLPLICQTPMTTCPIVTLEHHHEWHAVYVLHSNGDVERVPDPILMNLCAMHNKGLWVDQCYHPTLLQLVARHYGAVVDKVSLEAAAGRWVLRRKPEIKMEYSLDLFKHNSTH